MKKALIILLGLIISKGYGLEWHWNNTNMPDVRFALHPLMFTESAGASALFEVGRQNFRVNGTLGKSFDNGCFSKVSCEYLKQKLGIPFCSRREHHWVNQGAIGLSCLTPLSIGKYCIQSEWGISYSQANNKKLRDEVVPHRNEICIKKVAGSNGGRCFLGSTFSLWDSGKISTQVVYDYIKFKRTIQKNQLVSGLGINLALDQSFFNGSNFHMGIHVEAPYIAYDVSISTQIFLLRSLCQIEIYGQRVHGRKSIPNSSRIGIEIGFDLFKSNNFCSLADWLNQPAVYMPEVIVIKDKKIKEFGREPSGWFPSDIAVNQGLVNVNLSEYIKGTSPVIFTMTPLPPGLTLNPVSGKITGVNSGSVSGSFSSVIKVTNYFGTYSQPVTFNF